MVSASSASEPESRPESGAGPAPACRNCGHALGLPVPRFCPECGQETRLRAPTLMEFAQQFGGAYLSTEGALWRTLALLLARPGELTRQYLAGRRKHYVLPLRLYLTVSVVIFVLMRLTSAVHFDVTQPETVAEVPRNLRLNLGIGRAGLRDGVAYCEGAPQWVCRRIQARLDVKPAELQRAVESFSERFTSNLGAAMFCLLPTFALLLMLAWWNRGLRYTEHLVLALHLHTFWFLMLGMLMLQQAWLAVPAFLAVPVHTLVALRRVYGGRWAALLLRSALVSVGYSTALLLALVGLVLWSLVF